MEERWHSNSGVNVIYTLKSDRSKVAFDVDIVDGHPIAKNENAPAQGWEPIAVVHSAGLQWREPDGMGCPDAKGQLHDAATIMQGEAIDGITVVTIEREPHPSKAETKLGVRIAKTMDDAARHRDSAHLARLQSAVDPKDPIAHISLSELPRDDIEHGLITKLRDTYVYELYVYEFKNGKGPGPIERECEALATYAGKLLDGLRDASGEWK